MRPEVDRRLDPQVPLAEGDEAGELDDGAGAKMMLLQLEELQEHAEEGARRQPEPALEVREEDHALLPLGPRPLLAARQADADVRLPRQAPRRPELGDVLGGDVRAHPGARCQRHGRRKKKEDERQRSSARSSGPRSASVAKSGARAKGQEGASENNVPRPCPSIYNPRFERGEVGKWDRLHAPVPLPRNKCARTRAVTARGRATGPRTPQ